MSYYADLTPYEYFSRGAGLGVYNVGWLDDAHPYPQGSVPAEFLARLWAFCRHPMSNTRGFHVCELCSTPVDGPLWAEHHGQWWELGTAEIRVLGQAGRVYAAPDLIYHYVMAHRYRPPDEFVAAVLAGPDPDSAEYAAAIQHHGWQPMDPFLWGLIEEKAKQRQRPPPPQPPNP